MAELKDIDCFLKSLLTPENFKDASLNGLQVESSCTTINKIALAVDAGLSVIDKAIQNQAQLLIVHHGIFWGREQAIRSALARKIELLLVKGCSLMAWHLPLDAHMEVGNNIQIARALGVENCCPFLKIDGSFIGVKGKLSSPRPLKYFSDKARSFIGAKEPLLLNFGPAEVSSIGIVSGSAAFGVREAAAEGLDLFLTGEPKQEVYHLTKELGMNARFAGHYATETFGLLALGKALEKEFNLATSFIDEPTGI